MVALRNIPTDRQGLIKSPGVVADIDWYRYWKDLGDVERLLIASALATGGPGSGAIQGLTLTNSAGDVVNDIDVSLGGAVDSTGVVPLTMTSVLTKQLDAAWAAGTNQGGRMSAAAIADTTYHTFIIAKADLSGIDIGFDVSPTAPTLPADYVYFRRIGSFFRLAGAIVLFRQRGDEFLLATPVQDVNTNNPGTGAVTVVCSVPTGVNFIILAGCRVIDLTLAAATNALFQSTATANTVPAVNVFDIRLEGNPIAWGEIYKPIRSNLSSGFRYRLDQSTVDHFVSIVTFGWIDARGKN